MDMTANKKEKNSIHALMPSHYVKPITDLLAEQNAPEEVQRLSKATIKRVVRDKDTDSPLWPYIVVYAERRKKYLDEFAERERQLTN